MKYDKSELTRFAKNCSWGAHQMLNGICMAEEIKGNISRDILNNDEGLLLEVSKRFAKLGVMVRKKRINILLIMVRLLYVKSGIVFTHLQIGTRKISTRLMVECM